MSNDWAADERGYVHSTGDLLLEDAGVAVNEPGSVFTPDYRRPRGAGTRRATRASLLEYYRTA